MSKKQKINSKEFLLFTNDELKDSCASNLQNDLLSTQVQQLIQTSTSQEQIQLSSPQHSPPPSETPSPTTFEFECTEEPNLLEHNNNFIVNDISDSVLRDECLKMSNILNFEDLFDNSTSESTSGAIDRFLFKFLKLIVSTKTTYNVMDQTLCLLREELIPSLPMSHKTVIKKYASQHLDYDYSIQCRCGYVIIFKKKNSSNTIKCNKCDRSINFKKFCEENDHTCSFSIKDQIVKISETIKVNELKNPPANRDSKLELELLTTLDGTPLSKSSKQELYPSLVYVDNLKSKHLRNYFPIYKTFTLVTKKSKNKNIYDQMLVPLIDELIELENGFETEWSKSTTLIVKIFIGDSKVRCAVQNFLQHNGKYPCSRCYVIFDSAFDFPLLLSCELKLRDSSEIDGCLAKLAELRSKARNKTELSKLTNYKGVKGQSCLSLLKGFDLIKDVIIEIMHCVFLGVYKLSMQMILSESKRDYYLNKDCKEIVNNRLSMIKPPASFSRSIRSLNDVNIFTSKEFENLLLFTSYFVLFNMFNENKYFEHLMLLSSAIHKLYSKTATPDDVEKAKYEIDLYLDCIKDKNFKFSEEFFKYNFHILPHMYEDRIRFNRPLSE